MSKSQNDSIYVVGYPKSGNTWLAKLLGHSLSVPLRDSNKIHREFNERLNLSSKNSGCVIKKTHWLPFHVPQFEQIGTEFTVVYICRDVRDVAISAIYYWHQQQMKIRPPIFEFLLFRTIRKIFVLKFLKNFVNYGLNRYFPCGNWGDHISAWQYEKQYNDQAKIHFVRYEDLLENTTSTLQTILHALGLTSRTSEDRVREAVKAESFYTLKAHFKAKDDLDNYRFLRSGKRGEWKEYFNAEVAGLFHEKYYHLLYLLAYEHDINWHKNVRAKNTRTFIGKTEIKNKFRIICASRQPY